VPPFDVAYKVDRGGLEQLVCLPRQVVALALLLADRQEANPRGCAADRDARVRSAHDRELHEVLRTALDGGAGVEQDRRLTSSWNDGGESRTIDPGETAECGVRRHHRGAGVPGAEERRCGVGADGLRGNANRRVRLAAKRGGRWFRHLHAVVRVEDLDVERGRSRMAVQLTLDRIADAHQEQPYLEMPSGDQRTLDDARRRIVAAHRVDGYAHQSFQLSAVSFQLRSDS
jgi:hypothetical protein